MCLNTKCFLYKSMTNRRMNMKENWGKGRKLKIFESKYPVTGSRTWTFETWRGASMENMPPVWPSPCFMCFLTYNVRWIKIRQFIFADGMQPWIQYRTCQNQCRYTLIFIFILPFFCSIKVCYWHANTRKQLNLKVKP